MHDDQFPYRSLVQDLGLVPAIRSTHDVLQQWIEDNPQVVAWLDALRRRPGTPPHASQEDRWQLYALSRVLEVLVLGLQPAGDGSWGGPPVDLPVLAGFARALGLEVDEPLGPFCPFDHEVVEVVRAVGPDVAVVERLHWPRISLGPLMIFRAGVRVCASEDLIRADVAERSTLYWAWRRRHRPVSDLSHGWGSNSQWRTDFRRDYRYGSVLHFNVDAQDHLPSEEDVCTPDERVELLVNRCFVRSERPHRDLWPFGDGLVVQASWQRGATYVLPG